MRERSKNRDKYTKIGSTRLIQINHAKVTFERNDYEIFENDSKVKNQNCKNKPKKPQGFGKFTWSKFGRKKPEVDLKLSTRIILCYI